MRTLRTILVGALVGLVAASCGKSDGEGAGSASGDANCTCALGDPGIASEIACGAQGCYPVQGTLRNGSCTPAGWSDTGACEMQSDDGCSAGEMRCDGNTVDMCDGSGHWQMGAACAGDQRCAGGSCRPTSDAMCSPDSPAGACDIDCSAADSCVFATASCASDESCDLDCDQTSACQFSSLDCTTASSCTLQCDAKSACQFLDAECGPGDCSLSCKGESACQGLPLQPAILDCSKSSSCEVTCDDVASCQGLVVLCGDGPCTLSCDGQSSCQGAVMFCGDGPCSATCNGQSSSIFQMNCGASTSCKSDCQQGL